MPSEIEEQLVRLGFPREFAFVVAQQAHTPYTERQMLGYLRAAQPHSLEEVADELIAILDRRDGQQARIINEKGHKGMDGLFLRGLHMEWTDEAKASYAFAIPAIRSLQSLSFTCPITFFTGENGSGKSTLLEAVAVSLGLNVEGGTKNFRFSTYDEGTPLRGIVKPDRGAHRPEWSYFLRAESFYNVTTQLETAYNDDHTQPNYHLRSHGEGFWDFINNNSMKGLYLLDEPESALSAQTQLSLLIFLVRMAREGSQFLIATHSPILLGTPGAQILSFDDGKIRPISYEETQSYRVTKLFLTDRERMLRELLREDDEPLED